MRHGKKFNHLSRKTAHRKALLSNMASSLILHKRIKTTLAKAKALRKYVEPLVTRSKENTTHNRRMCFRYLQNKYSVTELFDSVATKVGDRPGGYTRIIRIGTRAGDNAEMAIIEFVDFNEVYSNDKKGKSATGKKRRRRGGSKKAAGTAAVATAAVAETVVEEETVVQEVETVVEEVIEEEVIVQEEVVEGIDPEFERLKNSDTEDVVSDEEE